MTIKRIQVVSVPVADLDRARDFYRDKLGFTVVADNPMGDQRWVQVAPSGGGASITLTTWFPTMPPGSLKGLVLETDDLDRDVKLMAERGVEIQGGVQEAPWGRFVTLDDPDGNGLIVQATRDPAAS